VSGDHGSNRGSILVVDDTPANLRLLTGMLKEQGYQTRPALNGRLALQAARKDPPDLILLDINMPQMNGYEVCRELKADEQLAPIPVIFISALDETADKLEAFSVGGVDYITKPFQFTEVQARVDAHLRLRRFQLEVEENYRQLKELEELRDGLTHMIVHDLRSPLAGILMGLQLSQRADSDEERSEDVDRAIQAAKRMMDMVTALLDVNRMETGEMPLERAEHDIREIVQEALDSLSGLTKERDVETELPDHPVTAAVDREIVRRILANLVSNAIRFTPEQGSIRVRVAKDNGSVRVEIQDSGRGIPEEFREKIFEKFGQVEARQESQIHSTGLGLTFCKLAAEAHGGEIGVDSEVGNGSTFWFTLPA